MPTAVAVIWWATLIVAVVAVLPLAWCLVHRVLLAARRIEQYAAETLDAGVGIARHTGAISALETTVDAAGQIAHCAGGLAASAEKIEHSLSRGRLREGGS